MQQRVGGSFAPPLSDELLKKYETMIEALPARSQVKDAMQRLLDCCAKWWDLPDPQGTDTRPHASGVGTIVDLHEHHAEVLWDHIPWTEELNGMSKLFDGIDNDSQRELRDAAHHLLWHVKELDLDREPLTADKLKETA